MRDGLRVQRSGEKTGTSNDIEPKKSTRTLAKQFREEGTHVLNEQKQPAETFEIGEDAGSIHVTRNAEQHQLQVCFPSSSSLLPSEVFSHSCHLLPRFLPFPLLF